MAPDTSPNFPTSNYPITRLPDSPIPPRLVRGGLADIAEKVEAGERLTLEDGVRLFDCPDLLAVGWLANRDRERRHGGRTFYNFNIRLEATNVCVASCLFCAFARLKPGDAGAYTMSLDQAWDKLRQRQHQPLTEVHVVNGLHPDLPFDYYTELLRGFKRIRPDVHLKCFTAVEIAFFADLYGMTDEQVFFLGDILSTGYVCAENAGIRPGDRVAIFGAGPVGLLALQSAHLFGPSRVFVVDRVDYRLKLAEELGG